MTHKFYTSFTNSCSAPIQNNCKSSSGHDHSNIQSFFCRILIANNFVAVHRQNAENSHFGNCSGEFYSDTAYTSTYVSDVQNLIAESTLQ